MSFVTTGSMEPTLDPGDGFVALPTELTGTPGEGDVVVFESREVEGGGLTTHRIVEETDRGYITRGDANPFTDQDGGEPPVQEAQVVAVAWQPGDDVLVIPFLGSLALGIQSALEAIQIRLAQLFGTRLFLGTEGLGYLIFAASVVLYVVAGRFEADTSRERDRTRETGPSPHVLMLALTLVVLAGVTAPMVIPAGTQQFSIVSAEFESESPTVIEQGTSESVPYEVSNTGVVSTVVVLESKSDNLAVEPQVLDVPGQSSANLTLTLSAPPETGAYRLFLDQRQYLGFLPTGTILSLYEVHPWLPILAIDLLVGVPFYLLGLLVLGRGRYRSRSRDGPSRLGRLRSRLL